LRGAQRRGNPENSLLEGWREATGRPVISTEAIAKRRNLIVIIFCPAKYNDTMDERDYHQFSYHKSLASPDEVEEQEGGQYTAEPQKAKVRDKVYDYPEPKLKKSDFWIIFLCFALAVAAALLIANGIGFKFNF